MVGSRVSIVVKMLPIVVTVGINRNMLRVLLRMVTLTFYGMLSYLVVPCTLQWPSFGN
jgi:hypothetical protein